MLAHHIPKPFRAVLWTFTAAALAFPAVARSEAARGVKPLRADAAIGIVRGLYAKAERYTSASGTPVELELSGCRALYPNDFSREAFSGLFDLAPGRELELTATVLADKGLGVSGANFLARWKDPEDEAGTLGIRAAVEGASIAEILSRLRTEDPAYDRRLEPIVSCNVTATAEGESRSYRAAFFFSPGSGESPLFVSEPVVFGLERLARETLPPVRDFTELRGERSPATSREAKVMTCVADQAAGINHPINDFDAREHLTGEHASQLQLAGLCSETSNCVSQCTPTFGITGCTDEGTIDSIFTYKTHRATTERYKEGDSKYNAPSYCKAALGCAVQSCLFGLCGSITFSLAPNGIGVAYATSPAPFWGGNQSDTFACPPPEPITLPTPGNPKPPPIGMPLPPDGGGPDGGSFGAGGGCYWSCSTSWDGHTYSESCDLIC